MLINIETEMKKDAHTHTQVSDNNPKLLKIPTENL
jgi:hypothetical protein